MPLFGSLMIGGGAQPVGLFAQAVGSTAPYGRTSPTGAVWTQRTIAASARDIAWNGSIYCCVTNGRDTYTSLDGITWTIHVNALPAGSWDTIAWGNNQFIALQSNSNQNQLQTSPDGINWTTRNLPTTNSWCDAIWNGTVWVVVSQSGSATWVYSMDGITWNQTDLNSGTYGPNCVGWNGSLFVAIGSFGFGYTSVNGINWNSITISGYTNGPVNKLIWNGSIFVTATNNGKYMTGTDGVNWTIGNIGSVTTVQNRALAWNGNTFCIAGLDGGTKPYTGSNGTSWAAGTAFTGSDEGRGMTASYLTWGTY